MKFNNKGSRYTLSTGKSFYAYSGILGLCMDYEFIDPNDQIRQKIQLVYGYDGLVNDIDPDQFTLEERKEIAEEMIHRWQIWAESGK